MDRLLIVDGNSLAYRGFHALKNSDDGLIYSAAGVPVTVCQTFLKSVQKLMREHEPDYIVICFDPGGKTWRHEIYPKYKGDRIKDESHDDFSIDLRNLKLILKQINITTIVINNYEADDAIATLVRQLTSDELEIIVSSTDKDLLQLVNDDNSVSVYWARSGKAKLYREADVFEDLKVRAAQVADYKALRGDPSDNIPGVRGIGQITASSLLDVYPDVEAIAEDIENLKTTLHKKIEPEQYNMLLFKNLTKLKDDLDISVSLDQLRTDLILEHSAIATELGI